MYLKKLLTLLLLCLSLLLAGQVPQSVKYQAVCRNADGTVRANADIALQLKIHSESPDGQVVYDESHSVSTNAFGLFSVNLGTGSTTYDFSEIGWGQAEFFLEVITDGNSMGATQLLSVPYALYAGDAAKLGGATAQEWDEAVMGLIADISALKQKLNQPLDTVLMKSPNGKLWKVTITDDGVLQTVGSDALVTYTYWGRNYEIDSIMNIAVGEKIYSCNKYIKYSAEGFYSGLTRDILLERHRQECEDCTIGPNDLCDSVTVELKAVDPAKFCGTAFTYQWGYATVAEGTIQVYNVSDNSLAASLQTDAFGRFSADLDPGTYRFHLSKRNSDPGTPSTIEYYDLTLKVGSYQDLHFVYDNMIIAFKPNIYLYPDETEQVKVSLSFPKGGAVIESDPVYGDGWDVTIEPNGTIDNKHGFLFYESKQPDEFQYSSGWLVAKEDLTNFFVANMKELNFNETEINDFIEYWIPKWQNADAYLIYPQFNTEIDPLIELSVSPKPESVNRLFYCVKESAGEETKLTEPVMPDFKRDGFTVMEWGVILK